MSIAALVFSRDRPAQLDLLLTSLEQNAPDVFDITVLVAPPQGEMTDGYARCSDLHPDANFWIEDNFADDVRQWLAMQDSELVTTFCDDDVLYQPMAGAVGPEVMLANPDMLCFSLRLGQGTGLCYPLRRLQGIPAFNEHRTLTQLFALSWPWRTGDADYGYPGSLDGNIWRADDLRSLLAGRLYSNPNTLEDALVAGCAGSLAPMMACFPESVLVGVPWNRVAETHGGNRYGEAHFEDAALMNKRFLRGERLDLAAIRADKVTGAHTEFAAEWIA